MSDTVVLSDDKTVFAEIRAGTLEPAGMEIEILAEKTEDVVVAVDVAAVLQGEAPANPVDPETPWV